MASSSAMLVSFALIWMIISMFIAPSSAQKHAKLKAVCSKTFNGHWCVEIMKKDRRTSYADNRAITEVAIDLAYDKAQDIQDRLNDRADMDYEPQLKQQFVTCSKDYKDVVRELEETKNHFKDGNAQRVAAAADDVIEEINDCDDMLDRLKSEETKDIRTMNDEVELLCDVIKISSSDSDDDD